MIAERPQITDLSVLPRLTTRPTQGRDGRAGDAADSGGAMGRHRSMAHRGALPLRRARALNERDRAPGAVLVAAFTVSLLCLYVSAYARVTAEGFELSRLQTGLRRAEIAHETLQAEVSRLSLPSTVRLRAAALEMESNTPDSTVLVGGTAPVLTASLPPAGR